MFCRQLSFWYWHLTFCKFLIPLVEVLRVELLFLLLYCLNYEVVFNFNSAVDYLAVHDSLSIVLTAWSWSSARRVIMLILWWKTKAKVLVIILSLSKDHSHLYHDLQPWYKKGTKYQEELRKNYYILKSIDNASGDFAINAIYNSYLRKLFFNCYVAWIYVSITSRENHFGNSCVHFWKQLRAPRTFSIRIYAKS